MEVNASYMDGMGMGLDDGEECYSHTVDIQELQHCWRLGHMLASWGGGGGR